MKFTVDANGLIIHQWIQESSMKYVEMSNAKWTITGLTPHTSTSFVNLSNTTKFLPHIYFANTIFLILAGSTQVVLN